MYDILDLIYDNLLKINEFRGEYEKDDIELYKIQEQFQFFLTEFPYKFRSIILLMEIGNYTDASIILRSLIETFCFFKYYAVKNQGQKLIEYINQDKKSKIRIKDIMEDIAPGFYDKEYALLCNSSHGNPNLMGILRGNVDRNNYLKYNMYNINEDWASMIINLTLPLIVGMFNMFDFIFKDSKIKSFKSLDDNIKIVLDFINSDIVNRYERFPKQREMIDKYKMMITF